VSPHLCPVNFLLWNLAIGYYRERAREPSDPARLARFVDRMDRRLGLK
jgi:hypothetical protein